jgi:uncharacterized tellurite resistance protein B-like protein
MGFLDNIVSDLVKNTTGVNARGFVRMVGGKNILLLGGAALAGAMAVDQTKPRGKTPPPPPPVPGEKSATPPPPPPPLPGATSSQAQVPPPLPPVPDALTEPARVESENLPPQIVYAIVRTMVAAALADGHLAAEEKELIHKHLGSSGLSPEQIGQIHKDLIVPPGHAELSSLVLDRGDKELVYRFGALVTLADGDVSELERTWLEQLAGTMQITPERRTQIESEILIP